MKYLLPTAVLAALAFVVFGTGLVEIPSSGASEPRAKVDHIPSYSFSEMRALAEQTDQLEEKVLSARQFSVELHEIENSLWAGKVGAFEAVDRARERSGELNPVYVRAAQLRFPELSEREAVLAVMLGGMRMQLLLNPSAARPATVLEDILCELSADPELSPELQRALSTIQAVEVVAVGE